MENRIIGIGMPALGWGLPEDLSVEHGGGLDLGKGGTSAGM